MVPGESQSSKGHDIWSLNPQRRGLNCCACFPVCTLGVQNDWELFGAFRAIHKLWFFSPRKISLGNPSPSGWNPSFSSSRSWDCTVPCFYFAVHCHTQRPPCLVLQCWTESSRQWSTRKDNIDSRLQTQPCALPLSVLTTEPGHLFIG